MNFLTEFAEYSKGTEAPENYHVWTAIGTMSAILGGRVWLKYGRFKVLANTYIVLLGPPGNGKTTSMGFGQKILRAIPGVNLSAQAQTKEALVKDIAEKQGQATWKNAEGVDELVQFAPMAIFITELSHFLGPNSSHMIDFLTTVYDQDVYDNKTKNKGNETIFGPYVSILACTTPDWVSTYLKTDIITGGFTRRAIFVNEMEGTQRIPWPDETPEQRKAKENCVAIASAKLKLIGQMNWTNEAKIWYTNWYLKRELPKDPTIRGFARTRHMQMLKVAMILSVMENDNLLLEVKHLMMADELLTRIEPNMAGVFNAVGRNELHAVGTKILELLAMQGGAVTEKQVLVAMSAHASTRELNDIINALKDTDRLFRVVAKLKGDGVPRTILMLPDAHEKLQAMKRKQEEERAAEAVKMLAHEGSSASPPSNLPVAD